MYKQMRIDDQKETIHRQQQECTEKTDTIIALGEQLKAKTQECEELKEIIQIQNKMQMEVCEEKNTELDQLEVNKKQAEQKLEQIRELLINITEAGLCEAKECGCDDSKECLECTLNEIKDVLQIIDEVE